MKTKFFLILIVIVLTAACSNNATEPNGSNAEPAGSNAGPSDDMETIPELDLTEGPDCYGEETHPIGESIADLFPEITDYDQVMTWFCNGFEFEDIVTALETQLASGTPVSDLLALFQSGKDWDTIWVELGIVED